MNYDFIIIGAGPAGYTAAIRAAQLHQSVLLAEENLVGGTCLNVGCIPTKALIHASQLYQSAAGADRFGVHLQAEYDAAGMDAYKEETVARLRSGVEALLKGNAITLVKGHAEILASHRVKINETEYQGEHILIATGSLPAVPPISGVQTAQIRTSTDLLNLKDHPFQHLAIIGGGVIGCEFANLFLNLGRQVTIIEAKERLLPEMDAEISQNLSMLLKRRGAKILTGAAVTALQPHEVWLGETKVDCDEILMAVGRRSNHVGLFAEGLIQTERGCISVDENMQTSLPDVYACGDCVHGIQLAHYAAASAKKIVEQIVLGSSAICLDAVPACVYLNQEIACVGLSEAQAKQRGIACRIGRYSMLGNSRSVIEKADRGFIKVVSNEQGVILGACMMCSRAADMIPLLSEAVAHHRTIADLAALIYPHPGFAEGIAEALGDTDHAAIHVLYRHLS